jgi:hypothetical protein
VQTQWRSIPANERSDQRADLLRKRLETKSESARDVKMVPKDGREGDTAVEAMIATMIVNVVIVGTGGVEVMIEMLGRTERKIDPERDAGIGMEIKKGSTVTDAIAMATEEKTEKEVTDGTDMEVGSVSARDREIDVGAAIVLGLVAETEKQKSGCQQTINRLHDTHSNFKGALPLARYKIGFEINN